jgi:hypothetical protein
MWYWLTCIVLLYSVTGCSTIAHWRQHNSLAQIDRIFAECEAKRSRGGASNWTETVRCGNDGARPIIAESDSPYVGLIEAALTSRLIIAQQIDAGVIPEADGQAQLATLDAHIYALPGSMLDLLNMTTTASPQ